MDVQPRYRFRLKNAAENVREGYSEKTTVMNERRFVAFYPNLHQYLLGNGEPHNYTSTLIYVFDKQKKGAFN